MSKMVYLRLESWEGISPGATHYYATLCGVDKSVKLAKEFTAETAKARNIKDRVKLLYRAGQLTSRFDSKTEAVEFARQKWREHFPEAVLLVLGSPSVLEPQFVLEGPPLLKKQINALYRKAVAIDFREQDEEKMEVIWNKWHPLVKNLLKC